MRRALALLSLALPRVAFAVPGPDSTAVVANANVPESVALAERYAEARSLPSRHVCRLDLPTDVTIGFDDYETRFSGPLEACLDGVLDRIEALVLTKGVPQRVSIPVEGGNQRASLAAVAATGKSTTLTGRPLAGREPGIQANCGGTPCLAARYPNPFVQGVFEAGWTRSQGSVIWRPLIVTALDGRSYGDAAKLVASATTAEAQGGATGDFVFMRGRDGARGVLDVEFPDIVADLSDLGFDAEIVDFDPNLEDRDLAALFVGTATIDRTIEGNRYRPGALVDNLTSFGAVPVNFEPEGESQVSIARWVAMGVAGVHGTTDEPLNNVFPSRRLIVDYVAGGTLGEAYFRRMPFAYWRNLVLGDPMTAPYAVRPAVFFSGVADGETLAGATPIEVSATDGLDRGIAHLALYLDGVEVDRAEDGTLPLCLRPEGVAAETPVQLLAVAQAADDFSPAGFHQPKGWTAITVTFTDGPAECATPDAGAPDAAAPDAAAPDLGAPDTHTPDAAASPDAGPVPDAAPADAASPSPGPEDDGGCRCAAPGDRGSSSLLLAGLIALGACRRRGARRRARRGAGRSPRTSP